LIRISTKPRSIEELNAALDKGGFVKMAFCGKEECELKIKELTNGGTARCIAEREPATVVAYFARKSGCPPSARSAEPRRLCEAIVVQSSTSPIEKGESLG
jgi:hypothetical protein